jgi:hypothetical protein
MRNAYTILVGLPEGRDRMGNLVVDRRIILRQMLGKYGVGNLTTSDRYLLVLRDPTFPLLISDDRNRSNFRKVVFQ